MVVVGFDAGLRGCVVRTQLLLVLLVLMHSLHAAVLWLSACVSFMCASDTSSCVVVVC